jgi:hypothetical protein
MRVRLNLPWVAGGLLCLASMAVAPASAQAVHKCVSQGSVTYSQQPCSGPLVSTDPAGVPVKPNPKNVDVQRLEEARIAAGSLRRNPDESAEQFATRQRRRRLLATDSDECARLDARMPVEQARMKNSDPAEVADAELSLKQSRKRFSALHC